MNERNVVFRLAVAMLLLCVFSTTADALLYRAVQVGDMWDPYVLYHDGKYYMFHMVGTSDQGWQARGMCLAASDDAVHWKEVGPVADGRAKPIQVAAGRVWKTHDRFMMNHGSAIRIEKKTRPCIRFWESNDLKTWKYRGDEKAVLPDPRWYGLRWDCMDAIPKIDGRTDSGWWGYLTGDTREDWPHMSIGMLESDDGVEWHTIKPPVIEWGDVPQQMMEVGGCQRIAGKYYLILGARENYLGNRGYSMFTFVADDAQGPFRPDVAAFRLSGASHRDATWLASFCRAPDGVLVCNYMSRKIPGPGVFFTPLKRAVIDKSGHLRLGYWKGNDAMKGGPIPLDARRCERAHPRDENAESSWQGAADALRLQAKRVRFRRELDGPATIVLLENRFNLDQGIVLEGSIRLTDTSTDSPIKTHITPAVGGFYIEEKAGAGTGVLFETYGITKIVGLTDVDGRLAMEVQDLTGPGCATVAGVHSGRVHRFRLLVRLDMIEIYLDDLLVQTFHISKEHTGRLGFLVQSGTAELKDLNAWTMNLAKEAHPQ